VALIYNFMIFFDVIISLIFIFCLVCYFNSLINCATELYKYFLVVYREKYADRDRGINRFW
jgi:hypothetical protein